MNEHPRYMISVAAELVGMHPQTLRIYEAKGLVRPKRTAGNTRLYSDADVERLRLIQRLTTDLGPQPRGRRARAPPRGRAAADAPPARSHGARDARGDRPGAQAVPPRPRALPAGATTDVEGTTVDGLQQADDQEPGGGRRSAGARAPPWQSRDLSRAPAARAARPGALRRLAAPSRRGRGEGRRRGRARAAGSSCRRPRPRSAQVLDRADKERAQLEDDFISSEHLFLALEPAPREEILQWIKTVRGGQRVTSQDPEGSYQALAEVRPRPHRGGRAGQARPGDRPRRGDPPRDPDPLAPHEEQPRADRRAGCRQDGDRRGPRAADRRRRRARGPEGPARLGPRHRPAARRLEVPRRVRGAAQGGADRDQRGRGPRSSSSSTSCTRSSAPARPRAPSTRRTCSSRCSPAASCAASARRRSTSSASTSRRTRRSSGASRRSSSASRAWPTRSRSCAG